MDANASRTISGINDDIDPPANAPSKLVSTRAVAEPRKTAAGLFVVPLIAKVAI